MPLDTLLREEGLIIRGLAELGLEASLVQLLSNLFSAPLVEEEKQRIAIAFSKVSSKLSFNIFTTLHLCSKYETICFLREKGIFRECKSETEIDCEDEWNPAICKYHQLFYLKKQGILKESPSKSELFRHTRIMFEFLLSELTKLKASLQIIQLLEEIMFTEGG